MNCLSIFWRKIWLISCLLLPASGILAVDFINWVNRKNVIAVNGGMAFTGNTIGLSKRTQQNQPGTSDAIGTYITTDSSSVTGSYPPSFSPPAGTTLSWADNSSTAYLDLPMGSTIIYAELIWGGSYGFDGEIPYNANPFVPDVTAVTLISPQNIAYSIMPDLISTNFEAKTPGYANIPAGNYIRTQDVTAIIAASGAGRYTVGGVPTTVAAADDTHNAATWTLAVLYSNPSMITSNLSFFIGAQQAMNAESSAAKAEGFCAPPSGPKNARLFVSGIEGDYGKTGDRLLFGPTIPLHTIDAVSGSNNPIDNFFNSQINTVLPLVTEPISGKLIPQGSGLLDTRGSYGLKNFPVMGVFPNNFGRQGADITSVDVSSSISYNQTTAYSQGTTSGDDYTVVAIGMQIQVGSPTLVLDKKVDGTTQIYGTVPGVTTFTLTAQNIGTAPAFNCILKDILEPGLSLVSGSFTVNGVPTADPDLVNGYFFGNLAENASISFEFQASIDAYPTLHSYYRNTFSIDYEFVPCQSTMIDQVAESNEGVINFLPLAVPDSGTTLVNTTLQGATVLVNDIGTGLTVVSYTQSAQGGVVAVNPDGTYSYTPFLDYDGPDQFDYTIQDAFGNQSMTTVYITVKPSQVILDDIIANDDSGITLINTPLYGPTVLDNDFGLDLIVVDYSQGFLGGTVVVDPYGTYTYIPFLNFFGDDIFTYTVMDSLGNTAMATVYITVLAEPPFGNNDSYVTLMNTPVTDNVLLNDSPTLTMIIGNTNPAHGTVVFSDMILGNFTYTPDFNFFGIDTFQYTAQDDLGNMVTQLVTITVLQPEEIVLVPDFNATLQNVPILNGPSVLLNDTGNNLVVVDYTPVSANGAAVVVNPNGTYTYTPLPTFSGLDTFTYTAQDLSGNQATTTVTILVIPDPCRCETSEDCTEGDFCTVARCIENVCSYEPLICTGGDQCNDAVCIENTGECSLSPRLGLPCSDADQCSRNDTCNGEGVCVGTPVTCDAPDTCSTASCNPENGQCEVEETCFAPTFCDNAEPTGSCIQCDEERPCPGDLVCAEGVCTGCITSEDCVSGDECTIALCTDNQCHYQPDYVTPGCQCNESRPCPGDLVCDEGICTGCMTSEDCVSGDECTIASCTDNQCHYQPDYITPGCQCNDDRPCPGDLVCDDGICTGCFTNEDCLNGEACTIAMCTQGQCHYQPDYFSEECINDGDSIPPVAVPVPVPVPAPVGNPPPAAAPPPPPRRSPVVVPDVFDDGAENISTKARNTALDDVVKEGEKEDIAVVQPQTPKKTKKSSCSSGGSGLELSLAMSILLLLRKFMR